MPSITGTIVFKNLEGGFWGIETKDANYLPLHMHEQLKKNGLIVTLEIVDRSDIMSNSNWGKPCEIVAFSTS